MKTLSKSRAHSSHQAGFTLLEIIIAVAVIAILAGAISLRAGGLVEKSRVSKVLQNTETLKNAAIMYNNDTGDWAREYSGYAATSRYLSGSQTTTGWAGPYIELPLTHDDNPWGSNHVYDTTTAQSNAGFDLDGDGTVDVNGNGSLYWLSGIPAEEAKAINDSLDAGIPGSWESTGRVNYNSSNNHMWILLHH